MKSRLVVPILCDPMNCSLPGSSVHGILQASILEWVALPFSGYLPNPGIEPRSQVLQADALPAVVYLYTVGTSSDNFIAENMKIQL